MQATCDNLRRLRPYLGTFVEIAAAGAGAQEREAAVEAAFEAVADVHRLMSFHDEMSDVSRLNRGAFDAPVRVHPWTFQVLETALDLHSCSNGMFDVRIAPALQKLGLLPHHGGESPGGVPRTPDHGKIVLLAGERVRFGDRATRIDLGGIAKGFAVDRVIDVLRDYGMSSGHVNAGGDLAAFGPKGVAVAIRDPARPGLALCRVELRDGALASSGGRFEPCGPLDVGVSAVIDPATEEPARAVIGATVRAPTCLLADALTKAVMIGGLSCAPLLRQFGASALLVSADGEVYITEEWHDAVVLAA